MFSTLEFGVSDCYLEKFMFHESFRHGPWSESHQNLCSCHQFQPTPGGMVFSHVLKQQPEMYMRLIAMIKMLQEYGNSDLTLASSWKLGKGLLEEMHIAKTSLGSGDHGIEWVSAGVSASERLKDLVVKRGPSVVLSLLDPEDKDKIQQAKALLSQMAGITGRLHSIRAVLEEPEAGWDLYSKDPPTDLMGVCKQLVVIVKTVAFDFEVIDQVRPGTKDQVTQYMGNVYTVLGDFVKSTEKQVEQWEKLLQQYKTLDSASRGCFLGWFRVQ